MKQKNLLVCAVLACAAFAGCTETVNEKEKGVTMTIYAEPQYGGFSLSDIWSEQYVFSETDDPQKRGADYYIMDNFPSDLEWGYEYTFPARKIWMANPPADVSNIKYVCVGPLTRTKIITSDSEQEMTLSVAAGTVQYAPRFPTEYDEEGKPKVYAALCAMDVMNQDIRNGWIVLRNIEGFTHDSAYEYLLKVKKITTADPYSVRYVLIEMIDKQEPTIRPPGTYYTGANKNMPATTAHSPSQK